jgi:hypothetical protein
MTGALTTSGKLWQEVQARSEGNAIRRGTTGEKANRRSIAVRVNIVSRAE